jgi:hypothetical protein
MLLRSMACIAKSITESSTGSIAIS